MIRFCLVSESFKVSLFPSFNNLCNDFRLAPTASTVREDHSTTPSRASDALLGVVAIVVDKILCRLRDEANA